MRTSRKQLLISNIQQVETYRNKITDVTNNRLQGLFQGYEGIELLKQIKFHQFGFDPLFDEPLNFIEMTNQIFTYLVCLKAVEILLTLYTKSKFHVNFGTEAGYDVISEDKSIICECFAATTPDSNSKLDKDTRKVSEDVVSEHKYVVFYASSSKTKHVENLKRKYSNVEIIALECI